MDNHSSKTSIPHSSPANPPPPSQMKSQDPDPGGVLVAKLKGQYHQPNAGLVLHMLQELQYLVGNWHNEILELDQRIDLVRQSGPIVAGWLEPAKSEVIMGQADSKDPDEPRPNDALPVITQHQNLDYQLCSLDESGVVAARDCPEPEMFGISKALARHRQLQQLIDRKSIVEANIKHTLATLVHLRMEIN
jgi:hypothetical protein